MNKENNSTKADQHDHNNHLPKDVLNLEQDPNSFRDPLEQQLAKSGEHTQNNSDANSNKSNEQD